MPSPDTGAAAAWEGQLVGESAAGQRLDRWLTERLGGELSRSRIRAMIEAGEVLCEGAPATPSQRVFPGQKIAWRRPQVEPPCLEAEAMGLAILHEDEHILVVEKPAGMVVHPGAGIRSGTLVNALLHHCGNALSTIGGPDRPGIVHRLDKDTSGILVVAKTDAAHRILAAEFADHGRSGSLVREYLALTWGCPDPQRGTVNAPLGRAADRVRRAVVRPEQADARHAVTHYAVLEAYGNLAAQLECRLETGRTHQIRVHLGHIGHPVIGDPLYGRGFATKARTLPEPARALAEGLAHQALHAAVLGFRHPASGEVLRFESPIPEDMAALVEALRNI